MCGSKVLIRLGLQRRRTRAPGHFGCSVWPPGPVRRLSRLITGPLGLSAVVVMHHHTALLAGRYRWELPCCCTRQRRTIFSARYPVQGCRGDGQHAWRRETISDVLLKGKGVPQPIRDSTSTPSLGAPVDRLSPPGEALHQPTIMAYRRRPRKTQRSTPPAFAERTA